MSASNLNTGALVNGITATTQAIGDTSTDVATDAFVANAISAQVDMHNPVQAATTAALIFAPTYSNGSSGVGATLTATTVGVLLLDGYTPVLGDRLLIKNQASTFQNGCYTVTTLGVVVTTDYVLTRCTDFNQTGNISQGDTFPVLNGMVNANQQFTQTTTGSITVGTTAIVFAQTSGGSQLSAGAGIAITGNSVALQAQYLKWSCQPGLGDGVNAITAATYLQSTCYNDTGVTVTLSGIKCFTDNSGSSTMNVTNGAGTSFLTGAVTCTSSFAAGTQSATVTIASGDFAKFTFVADGTSKQTTWVVSGSK